MALVSSRANPRVKAVRALRNRSERDAAGAFFAEGARLVAEAVRARAMIELVAVVPERLGGEDERVTIAAARAHGAEILEVTPDVYETMSFRGDPDSMGAVVRRRYDELPRTPSGELSWVAVLDIQHPGNLGTLIRTSDAAGGAGVIVMGSSTDPYHPVAVRGSLGAIFTQRVVETTEAQFAAWTLTYGANVIGTSPAGSTDYRQAGYSPPVVILSGSERAGLTEEQVRLCSQVVRIPMAGSVDSLNLSVATALVLYEAWRSNRG